MAADRLVARPRRLVAAAPGPRRPPGRRRLLVNELAPGRGRCADCRVERRADWEEVKTSVMGALVRQKFVTHPDLAIRLIATAAAHLEEGKRHGDRWGTVGGVGENRLGRILMGVRAELFQVGLAFRDHALSGELS